MVASTVRNGNDRLRKEIGMPPHAPKLWPTE